MGMSKDELSDIRLRYVKEELHILFKEKFSELKNNPYSTNPIFLTYDKFTFEYGYTKADDDINRLIASKLYMRILKLMEQRES